jgi:hypothetical protein
MFIEKILCCHRFHRKKTWENRPGFFTVPASPRWADGPRRQTCGLSDDCQLPCGSMPVTVWRVAFTYSDIYIYACVYIYLCIYIYRFLWFLVCSFDYVFICLCLLVYLCFWFCLFMHVSNHLSAKTYHFWRAPGRIFGEKRHLSIYLVLDVNNYVMLYYTIYLYVCVYVCM